MQCPPSSPPREVSAAMAAAKLLPGFSPSQDAGAGTGASSVAKGKAPPFAIYQDPELPVGNTFYPTPLPTSQADNSSPTRSPRALSAKTSEVAPGRVALSQLGFAKLPLNGDKVTVGRSSKSSMVSLNATNKLVSRVHAELHYDRAGLIVVECLGWNGLTVYVPCIIDNARVQKEYKVVKDQTIYIELVDGVSLNIHGERVIVEVEQLDPQLHSSEATEDEFPEMSALPSSPVLKTGDELALRIAEELRKGAQRAEPIALHTNSVVDSADDTQLKLRDVTIQPAAIENTTQEVPTHKPVPETVPAALPTIVENEGPTLPAPAPVLVEEATAPTIMHANTENVMPSLEVHKDTADAPSQAQIEVKSETVERASVHQSETKAKKRLSSTPKTGKSPKRAKDTVDMDEVSRLAINHVAFSRLASTPLSTIAGSSSVLAKVSSLELENVLDTVPYIGVIRRTGKDALGKLLENEYYYMPENDDDLTRRQLVAESKGARTLRSCRKTHKQYFYKKPRI